MPKYMIRICLIAVSLLMARTHADDLVTQDRQFASIARLLEQADNAFEANEFQDAGRLYGASVRAYEQFAQTSPGFAPDLVRFRIAYCRNQMALARQRLIRMQSEPATTGRKPSEQQPLAISQRTLQTLQDADINAIRAAHQQLEQSKHPVAPLLMAALLVKEGKLADARSTLARFLEDFPTEPTAHYNMAQLILREAQPDFEKARLHYRQAIDGGAPRDEDLEIVINF